ncbi:2981_t:CDS:2 [Ambispora leptoticha]|uniref:Spindle pole body component n=1 Tax=Ambispora leptoticha TaxID=144679 RepID=A0A9N9AR70_9GLOM|nr:2981_t:CDS:2 [Ambispora leptoticha]
MHHELLSALCGVSGDLFNPYPPQPNIPKLFKIPPDFNFLHESERDALERLAELGFHYRCIVSFINKYRGINSAVFISTIETETFLRGSFADALCNALDAALSEYQQLVFESEDCILEEDGVIPVADMVSRFSDYHVILSTLHELVDELEANPVKYFGCRILNLLVARCKTGVPKLRGIMFKLVHACHVVLYQYISSWMVYGYLQDTFGEFFIKDESIINKQQQQQDSQEVFFDEENNQKRRHQRFFIDESLIPNYIPHKIADSILFVGRAIATVRNADHSYRNKSMLPRNLSSMHLQYLLELSSKHSFNDSELDNVVSIIRNNVAQWLWQVVLTGDKVIECLETFRNYFLLGQGDFALSLIQQFEKLVNSRLISTRAPIVKEQELNSLLILASVGTLAENDLTLEKFRFRLVNSNDQKRSSTSILFDDTVIGIPLRLEYQVNWPLDLFVTSEDLIKYGDLFSFLMSLKRTQHRLHKAWVHLSALRKSIDSRDNNSELPLIIWRTRASMMFFVECIWSHVQMDIIESSFQKLICQISVSSARHGSSHTSNQTPSTPISTINPEIMKFKEQKLDTKTESLQDFEEIRLGHQSYLNDIQRGCLLESRVCAETIKKVLSICDRLCALLERWDGRKDDEKLSQINRVNEEFRDQVNFLFRTLSGVNQTPDGIGGPPRHLDQLLLRLDYSKWFSVWEN